MNMVEKVARSICMDDFDGEDVWKDLTSRHHSAYMENARAAIKAMRDPTEKMVDAIIEAEGECWHVGESSLVIKIYTDAIDAALSE